MPFFFFASNVHSGIPLWDSHVRKLFAPSMIAPIGDGTLFSFLWTFKYCKSRSDCAHHDQRENPGSLKSIQFSFWQILTRHAPLHIYDKCIRIMQHAGQCYPYKSLFSHPQFYLRFTNDHSMDFLPPKHKPVEKFFQQSVTSVTLVVVCWSLLLRVNNLTIWNRR